MGVRSNVQSIGIGSQKTNVASGARFANGDFEFGRLAIVGRLRDVTAFGRVQR